MKIDTPHPLAEIVWKAFAENDHQDSTSLGRFLSGGTIVSGDAGTAYRTVARDVLGYMTAQGLLRREKENGWWRPARPPRQPKDGS
jgi:hypothetical protein